MELNELVFTCLAVILMGVAKGGFGGVGTPVALPVMALGVPADVALGVLLPLLIAMDLVSMRAHRAKIDWVTVKAACPGALAGVVAGVALVSSVPANLVGGCVGAVAVLFAVLSLSGRKIRPPAHPVLASTASGAVSGLTSALAHAGGPPIHMYLLTKGYKQQAFVATSAAFMAAVNLIKLPSYLIVGVLTPQIATLAMVLAPLAVLSALGGVALARVLPGRVFARLVNALLIAAGVKLLFDALT